MATQVVMVLIYPVLVPARVLTAISAIPLSLALAPPNLPSHHHPQPQRHPRAYLRPYPYLSSLLRPIPPLLPRPHL
ncbi:hypothetical protein BJ165DRAFT_1509245 [Panaeolus papilionaceus]|nr:hypothetical protein BJ165DRAFT_1509245 [Panaeolus papilionaceus]